MDLPASTARRIEWEGPIVRAARRFSLKPWSRVLLACAAPSFAAPGALADGGGAGKDVWRASLRTPTPKEGLDLAASMARRAVKTAQPDVSVLKELRPGCARAADSLIDVSRAVAAWFATAAETNDCWRDAE